MIKKLIFIFFALVLFTGAFSLSVWADPPDSDPTVSGGNTETAIPTGEVFTPDGLGTEVDTLMGADGRLFYTVKSVDGNVFYLIIDTDRKDDNVYFLNAVTEDDLMSLAQKKNSKNSTTTSVIPTPTPTPQAAQPTPTPSPQPLKQSGGLVSYLWIAVLAVAAGGVGWYFKIYKPKQQAPDDNEADEDDYDDSDDEDGEDEIIDNEEDI